MTLPVSHRQDHPHYLLAPKLAGSRLRFQLTPSRSDYPAGHGRRPSAVAPEDETFDDAAPLQHPDPPQGGVRADRSGGGACLCLRAYGLRLRPYRQRPAGDRVRRSVPPAPPGLRGGPCRSMRATSPTSTTRSTPAQSATFPTCRSTRRSQKSPKRRGGSFTRMSPRSGSCLPHTSRAQPSTSTRCGR